MLDKFAVARALREMGTLLEVKGENPFKVRAYATGARSLEEAGGDLPELIAAGRLTSLNGIGEALEKKIIDLHQTGTTELLDRLRAELPKGILELVQVPELGPKKIAALHAALGISSLAELEAACQAGKVREVKGFGEKTEAQILENLARLSSRDPRLKLSDALELSGRLLAHLKGPPVERIELAGSARRMKELVSDVDLVASSTQPEEVGARLASFPGVSEVMGQGGTKTSVRLGGGVQVDLRVVAPEDHAALLHHLTGSKAHHVRLRGIARDKGYSLSEYGLSRLDDNSRVKFGSEEELYALLGLPYIPPELREDDGEIEAALAGTLPNDLIRVEDVKGFVHCHTRWSDGRATLEEMAIAAETLGAQYLTVTDHSTSAGYAGGLTSDRLKEQREEIEKVQEKVRVKLLAGTESDITEEGGLDFPDDVLERLDVIIASIHQRYKHDEEAMTRRLVRAMKLPVFKIWGHATGRLLLERDPFECRMEEVLDALASSRGAVEVNGDPHRMELEPRFLRMARERNIPVVVSVDAHSTAALGHLKYAVATARRGWVRKGDVLNALPFEQFKAAVRPAV